MHLGLNLLFLVSTVIVSFMGFNNAVLFHKLKFNPYRIKHNRESWRFFSHALIHADWLHLLVNMYVLYSFGGLVESVFRSVFGNIGMLYYVLLYIGGVLFSSLYDFGKHKDDPYYNAVGASGAVSAVVFSSILIYPQGGLTIFPIPFSIPSWIFGILYLLYSAYMGKRGTDNVAHNAHLWGAVFGIIYTVILIPETVKQLFAQLFGG